MKYALAALAAATLAVPASAQMQAPAPAIAAPDTTAAVLRAGTPVSLTIMEEVTTKKKAAKVNDRVRLEVTENVEVDGVVVIPAGSPGMAELTLVRNKGMWGKSGKLEARILYLRVNGRQIRMSGSFDDKGTTGTASVVGAAALLPVAGFFLTGTSAVFPKGATVNGFVDEDVPLAIARTAPAPMVVGVPATSMTVETTAEADADIETDLMTDGSTED